MAPGIESERKERNGDGGVAEQKLLGCILLDTYGREGQRNEEKYSGDNPKGGSFRLLPGVWDGGKENADLRFRNSIRAHAQRHSDLECGPCVSIPNLFAVCSFRNWQSPSLLAPPLFPPEEKVFTSGGGESVLGDEDLGGPGRFSRKLAGGGPPRGSHRGGISPTGRRNAEVPD